MERRVKLGLVVVLILFASGAGITGLILVSTSQEFPAGLLLLGAAPQQSNGGGTGPGTLGTPTGVSATDGTSTSYSTVTWNGVSGAESYHVYRSTSPSGTYSHIGQTTSLSFNDVSAGQGTLYYYKVRAYSLELGYSDYSSYDTGFKKLIAPTGVIATNGTSTSYSRVTWNSVTGAESYYIYRSTSSSGSYSYIGQTSSLSYDDTSAGPGTLYYYKVRAHSSVFGFSDYSSYDTGFKKLSTPTGVSASDGTYSDWVRVTWNAVPGADLYGVFVFSSSSMSDFLYMAGETASLSLDDTIAGIIFDGIVLYYRVAAASFSSNSTSDLSSYNTGYTF